VIEEPPLAAEAVKATDAEPLLYARPEPLLVTAPIVGACAVVVAVIELDEEDAGPLPVELVGTAVKV
jgi:hypothetical protein